MKYYILGLLILFFTGCNNITPKPEIKEKKQYVNKTITTNHFKVLDFKRMIDNDDNINPIYIYLSNSLKAEASSSDLPDIKKVTYSLLSDFGEKVIVITSYTKYKEYLLNPNIKSRLFELDGALTSFDKSIESQSSSTSLNLTFGGGDGKTKNRNKFKNKKRVSQLISDFYLKQDGFIKEKTTSSILIRETNKGYQFGLNLYGMSLGVSSYKNIKDGLGLSVRKIVEASLIDLVAKSIGIKTFQVMPEIQAKKVSKNVQHLSNFDFCSDINKLVFYIDALKDKKFNSYGITNKSEENKLSCLKDLYEKDKNILIKIIVLINPKISLSKAQRNAQLLRRKISQSGIPRGALIMENKKSNEQCTKSISYCNFINNRAELEKLYLGK